MDEKGPDYPERYGDALPGTEQGPGLLLPLDRVYAIFFRMRRAIDPDFLNATRKMLAGVDALVRELDLSPDILRAVATPETTLGRAQTRNAHMILRMMFNGLDKNGEDFEKGIESVRIPGLLDLVETFSTWMSIDSVVQNTSLPNLYRAMLCVYPLLGLPDELLLSDRDISRGILGPLVTSIRDFQDVVSLRLQLVHPRKQRAYIEFVYQFLFDSCQELLWILGRAPVYKSIRKRMNIIESEQARLAEMGMPRLSEKQVLEKACHEVLSRHGTMPTRQPGQLTAFAVDTPGTEGKSTWGDWMAASWNHHVYLFRDVEGYQLEKRSRSVRRPASLLVTRAVQEPIGVFVQGDVGKRFSIIEMPAEERQLHQALDAFHRLVCRVAEEYRRGADWPCPHEAIEHWRVLYKSLTPDRIRHMCRLLVDARSDPATALDVRPQHVLDAVEQVMLWEQASDEGKSLGRVLIAQFDLAAFGKCLILCTALLETVAGQMGWESADGGQAGRQDGGESAADAYRGLQEAAKCFEYANRIFHEELSPALLAELRTFLDSRSPKILVLSYDINGTLCPDREDSAVSAFDTLLFKQVSESIRWHCSQLDIELIELTNTGRPSPYGWGAGNTMLSSQLAIGAEGSSIIDRRGSTNYEFDAFSMFGDQWPFDRDSFMETKLQILARLNHRYGQATDEFKPAAMAFDILALADYGRSDRHKEFAWDHDGDPIGLCPEGDEPPCLFCQAMREVHEMLGPIAEFFDMRVNGRYNYLDIVPAGCSKFEALRWWLEHSPSGPRVRLSRSQAESVTPAVMLFHFGDNRNDKSFGQAYLQGYRSSHLIRVSRDSGMDPQHTTTRLAIDGVIDFLEILRLMLKSRRMPPDKRQNRIIKL